MHVPLANKSYAIQFIYTFILFHVFFSDINLALPDKQITVDNFNNLSPNEWPLENNCIM